MYLRTLTKHRHGTPRQAAKKAKQVGVSFVAILVCWQDTKRGHVIVNQSALAPYAAAFQSEGIRVYVWGYPHPGLEKRFMARLEAAVEEIQGQGVILDPEVGYKGSPRFLHRLVDRAQLIQKMGYEVGFTSYGIPTFHPDFPWQFVKADWGSPQTYSVPVSTAHAGIHQWRNLGFSQIVVSLPAFGRNDEENMREYARQVLEKADGAIFWSWRSFTEREWQVVRDLSEN